jgi:uncharacterized protein
MGTWTGIRNTQRYVSWSGYAFENLCLKHTQQIKNSLGIGAIYSEQSAWYSKQEKVQIDLVMQRADRCTNICEMKFTKSAFELTAKYAKELQRKAIAYSTATKSKNSIFITLVTTEGIKQNTHSINNIDSVVVLSDLFK